MKTQLMREFKSLAYDEKYKSWYEGEQIFNIKDGRGVEILSNGSRYDGFWQNGNYHGYGRLVNTKGDVFIGLWECKNC